MCLESYVDQALVITTRSEHVNCTHGWPLYNEFIVAVELLIEYRRAFPLSLKFDYIHFPPFFVSRFTLRACSVSVDEARNYFYRSMLYKLDNRFGWQSFQVFIPR